jgi:aspartate-semialdehyde dehydrogenase
MILGVIGASLLGGEILTVAENSGLHHVRCFDTAPIDGFESSFRGGVLEVEQLVVAEMKKCDVVICATDDVPGEILKELISSSTKFIDCSGLLTDLPLVHPYINSSGIEGHKVRIPHTNAAHLVDVLSALLSNKQNPRIASVVDTIFEPVGSIGHSGIDELWQQGIAIYNHRGIDIEHFSAQTAFNCIAFGSTDAGSEGSKNEVELADEIEFFSGVEKSKLILQMVRVPTYSATCHSLTVFFESLPTEKEIIKGLKAVPSIRVLKSGDELTQPLTLGETSVISVDRVRAVAGNGVAMWVVADNNRIRAQMALDVAQGFLGLNFSM